MYPAFYPRLGILHFTLAMVFVPFGAPQAESGPGRVRPAIVAAPAAHRPPAARVVLALAPCIARGR